jgi:hypothetical protein
MKKIIRIFSALAVFTAVFSTSCSPDDSIAPSDSTGGGGGTAPASFFSAKVGDNSFPTADVKFTTATFVNATKMLQITGQPADRKETIVLTLMPFGGKVKEPIDWKPGSYDFDPIHVTNVEYLASAEYNKWNGSGYDQWFTKWDYVKTGKIIIESNSGTHIKGTFYFDAVLKNTDGTFNSSNIKQITEGTFDLDLKTL